MITASQTSEVEVLREQLALCQLENRELRLVMHLATVQSCTCLTKTSEPAYHDDSCRYKIIKNALDKKYTHEHLQAYAAAQYVPLPGKYMVIPDSHGVMHAAKMDKAYEDGEDAITLFRANIQNKEGNTQL